MQQQNLEAKKSGASLWRIIGWGGLGCLLLLPAVAMQFTDEVNWDETDFIVAGLVFSIVGGLVELAVQLSSNWFYRIGAFFGIFSGFVVVWSNLAIGMIGNENNPINLLFIAVLLIALGGAILGRFRNTALVWAMLLAGLAQAAIGIGFGVLGTDIRGGIFTLILSSLWLLSATLFHASHKT
jgi:hypothetical protein